MQDVDKLVKQVARLLRKSGVENYDQTKHIFREIRKELDLSPPKRRGRDTVKRISLEQLRSFLDHAQRHSATRGLMMQALYETAVRVDEFVNLRVEHFLYEQRRLVVVAGKGDKRREIPLTSALSNLLRIHNDKRTEGPIFRSTKGSAFTCRRIQQIVDEVASNAVLTTKVSPHIPATHQSDRPRRGRDDPTTSCASIPRPREIRHHRLSTPGPRRSLPATRTTRPPG